jgi:hypothetical protein
MDVKKFLNDAEEEVLENFEDQAETTTWGLERENQTVRPDGSVPSDRLHQQTLANIAANHPYLVKEASSDSRSPRDIPKEAKMDAEKLHQWAKQNGINYDITQRAETGPDPANDVDLWNQLELGTSAWEDFQAMLGEAKAQYEIAEQNLPENLEFSNRGVSESITYNDETKGPTLEFAEETYDAINQYFDQISDKGRYVDYVKFFGPGVLLNGLTGSVQVSGQPRKINQKSWQENISQYQVGTLEKPGMLALKPIQRIPFSNSLLTDENSEKESVMGRKKVWDITPSTSPVLSKEEGQARHGLQEEFFEKAEQGEEYGLTVADQLEVIADRDLIFTGGISEERLEYLDDDPRELHERYDHLDPDQEYNMIVMSPDRDPESTQTLREFLETQQVSGMISVEDPETSGFDEIPVSASFEEMDYDEFFDVAWGNTKVQNSTNWPYDRLRLDGWFEDRVECDSENWDDAAIHSAVWKQKWPEFQNIASRLGIENGEAQQIEQEAYEQGEEYELAQQFYDEAMVDHYEAAAALVGPDRAEKYIQNLEKSLNEGTNATKEYNDMRTTP